MSTKHQELQGDKRNSFRKFCKGLTETTASTRIHGTLAKSSISNQVGFLKTQDDSYITILEESLGY